MSEASEFHEDLLSNRMPSLQLDWDAMRAVAEANKAEIARKNNLIIEQLTLTNQGICDVSHEHLGLHSGILPVSQLRVVRAQGMHPLVGQSSLMPFESTKVLCLTHVFVASVEAIEQGFDLEAVDLPSGLRDFSIPMRLTEEAA